MGEISRFGPQVLHLISCFLYAHIFHTGNGDSTPAALGSHLAELYRLELYSSAFSDHKFPLFIHLFFNLEQF